MNISAHKMIKKSVLNQKVTLLYIIIFVISGIHCHIYHIISTTRFPCQTQPCFTLSEFTNISNNLLNSSTITLLLQPGEHILETELRIVDKHSFKLEKSSLSLRTNIICKQSSALYLQRISEVHISKLVFTSCGGNKVEQVGQLSILNTFFHGQGSQSTALIFIDVTGIIEESTLQFHYNTDANMKNLTVKNWTGEKIQTSNVGGALSVTRSNLTIIRSTFKHNGAEVGGAIFCELESSITIINTTFSLNHATTTSTNQCYGGAIFSQGGCSVTVINGTFYKNRACSHNEHGGGGAIAAVDGTEMNKRKCVFTYNEAEYGGAVLVWKAILTFNESVFHNNEATGQGGAVCAWESTIAASMCRFNKNRANYVGGALQTQSTTVDIISCKFVQNDATSGGAISASDGHVAIDLSTFIINEVAIHGGAITTHRCALKISASEFNKNKASWGGAIRNIDCSIINITDSRFINNTADEMRGGAISVWSELVDISSSEFIGNEASTEGGAIELRQSGTIHIDESLFINNIAAFDGGAIYANQINAMYMLFMVTSTKYENNEAQIDGGAIKVRHNTTTFANIEVSNSTFSNNSAKHDGGAISIVSVSTLLTVAVVNGGNFDNNEAINGGAIHTQRITISINDSCFSENTGVTGIVYTTQSAVFFSGDISMWNNAGSMFLFSSNLTLVDKSRAKLRSNIPSQLNPSGLQQGGAITAVQTNIVIYGACILMDNNANDGGAIHATESKILIYGEVTVTNNTALNSGGGFHLYQSEVKCSENGALKIQSNKANEKGGGIHAISSLIISELKEKSGTLVDLSRNSAKLGGGICMEVNARIYILKLQHSTRELNWWNHRRFILSDNSADFGAAVYVADDTNFATCSSNTYRQYSTLTECFIQVLALHDELRSSLILDHVNFTGNLAQYSGSTLYGGLLDRCTVSPYAEVYSKYNPNFDQRPDVVNGITFIKAISTIVNYTKISISSEPVQICFCEDVPNCNLKEKDVAVKKGYRFTISLVAVDQVNHTVSATIRSALLSIRGGLDEDQASRNITDSCSTLKFSVFSPHESEKLIMHAEGPCKDSKLSQKQINIQFLPCICPVGFQTDIEKDTQCVCECDVALQHIITECYVQNKTLVRRDTFWIFHLNTTDNSNTFRYLIYPYCPLDYCHPPTVKVYINLSEENGSDAQCNFNRSGTLCGKCLPGFSVSLGSSRCVPCSKHWPAVCALVLGGALLAGIALVALLLMLNLTVATGTSNGIIFYANVINANKSTFYPFSKQNFITVLVSWLNLELGFDVCFFEGMDMYWKIMVQLAFPVYVFLLVIAVIFVSEHSTKFARLIGRKNPVATLATLVLLSYTRLIQTIIAGLSFSILEYPDHSHELVWLPDGDVGYLTGKHVVLFVLSLGILLAGIAYTTFLFSWQWLLFYRHKKIFKFLCFSNKLILFLEPYHAPYSFKYRYWTGLLLIVRVTLYLASALNFSRSPAIDMLVTTIVVITVFMLKAHVGMRSCIYRKLPLDIIENTCYINIILFSVASLYMLEAEGDQTILAYISGTVTLVLLLAVLLHHTLFELCPVSKVWNRLKLQLKRRDDEISLIDYQAADELRERLNPTVTWVDPPSNEEGSLILHTVTD